MAALTQASRQYFRTLECKNTEQVLASKNKLHSEPVLDGTVQLLLKVLLDSARRKTDANQSASEKVSVSRIKKTAQLVTDLLGPGGHAFVLCSTQRFRIWHRIIAVAMSTQHDGLIFSSSFGSKRMLMVSA